MTNHTLTMSKQYYFSIIPCNIAEDRDLVIPVMHCTGNGCQCNGSKSEIWRHIMAKNKKLMNKTLILTAVLCLLLSGASGCNRTEINEFRKLYGNDVNEPIIDHRDGFTTTQLHKAAVQHDIAVVKYLIRKGAKPDALDSMGMTPLHRAAYSNKDLRVVKYLFPKTPKIKWTTKDGVTLYHCSANNENLDVAYFIGRKYSFADRCAVEKDGNNSLHWAVWRKKSKK